MSNTNSNINTINTLDNEDYMDYQETNRDDDREDFSNEWKIGLSEEDIYHIENMNALEEEGLLDYYSSLEVYNITLDNNVPELTIREIEGMNNNSFGYNYNKPYRTPEEEKAIKEQRKANKKAKKALKNIEITIEVIIEKTEEIEGEIGEVTGERLVMKESNGRLECF